MAKKIEIEFELKYKEAVKNLDEFQKEFSNLEKDVQSANEKTADALKKVEKSAEDGAKGVKKVGVSIRNIAKATGVIFLLQKAFEFVSSAIQENQQVMDGLNTIFTTAQIIFNQVANVFVDVYRNVLSATENFDALGRVVSGIVTIALTPLKLSFFGIKLALQQAQLIWEKSFFGDGDPKTIKELNLAITETKVDILEVGQAAITAGSDIVNNFGEAITEVGEIGTKVVDGLKDISIEAAIETAKTNQALAKSAQIAAAESRILLEQYDRQAEIQRQIRDDETKSIEERKKANDELAVILNKQEIEMTKNANLVKASAQAQLDLTGKTEDYVAVLDAEAEVQAVAATVTGFRSEQQINKNALDKEAIEITNAKLESESLLSIEQKRFNAEQIEDELLRLEALQDIDVLEAEQESVRLQAIVDNANAGTKAKIDAQLILDQFNEQSRQTNLTRDKEIADAKKKIQEKAFQDAITIAGAESKLGKAIFIAKQLLQAKEMIMEMKGTLFSARQSATKTVIKASEASVDVTAGGAKAASAAPFPANIPLILGYAAQAVGIVSAIRGAMKASKAATSQLGVSSPSPKIAPPTTTAGSIPPAFNIVGASGTNQLADAIGGQSQQPIQAFVVSSEVTTSQELDRNIIDEASIGG